MPHPAMSYPYALASLLKDADAAAHIILFTYHSLINACGKAERAEQAMQLFEAIRSPRRTPEAIT